MRRRIELCRAAEVAVGTPLRVEAEGLVVAVFNLDGEYFVTDDACTHGPGSLGEGYVDGDGGECNFHGGRSSIRTGGGVAPPCWEPVKTSRARVENGMVVIEA